MKPLCKCCGCPKSVKFVTVWVPLFAGHTQPLVPDPTQAAAPSLLHVVATHMRHAHIPALHPETSIVRQLEVAAGQTRLQSRQFSGHHLQKASSFSRSHAVGRCDLTALPCEVVMCENCFQWLITRVQMLLPGQQGKTKSLLQQRRPKT